MRHCIPFPVDVPEALANTIRAEAAALDALCKRLLAEYDDLILAKLYYLPKALRSGKALGDVERDIHVRELVVPIAICGPNFTIRATKLPSLMERSG